MEETLLCDAGLPELADAQRDIDTRKQEHQVQLRLARQVQERFYRSAPKIPGFDVAAGAHPAYETGGDYFDFIPLAHNRVCIAMGDVEGHGFGSALVMALTRAYVRSFAALGLEIDQILALVNRMLLNDLGDRCLVTMLLISLDVPHQSFVYVGAGHVPGYVLDGSGSVAHILESDGPPLGLFPEMKFGRGPGIKLRPGDLVALLTDGILESTASDGHEWGVNGVLTYLRDHREHSAVQIERGLYQQARRFSANELQEDDITSVVFKVTK
jgi:serine phosphatase RsbU (regulator of sigma subunit)